MGDLIEIGGITALDIDPDRLLRNAIGKLDSFVLSGFDKDGKLYTVSSQADGAEALWLIEKFKQALLNAG